MMTSYVAPIRSGARRVGAAGIDLALRYLETQTRRVQVLDSGYAFVASDTGRLVAFPAHKGWAGSRRWRRSPARGTWRDSPASRRSRAPGAG